MKRPLYAVLPVIAAFLALTPGCPLGPTGTGPKTPTGAAKLIPFGSAQEMLGYIRDLNRQPTNFGLRGGIDVLAAGGDVAPAAAEDSNGGSFSTTNIQELGVDEADYFKSDGTYFYIAAEQSLRIVRAAPRDALAPVGRLNFDRQIHSIYLTGQRVLALLSDYGSGDFGGPELMIWPPYYRNARLHVVEVDVSDPANPTEVRRIELDGALVSSRLIDTRLVLVMTVDPDVTDAQRVPLDNLLPRARTSAGEVEVAPWSRWLRPEDPFGSRMTVAVTLDTANIEQIASSVGVLADAQTIYASRTALYIAQSRSVTDDQGRFGTRTDIHRLNISERGNVSYAGSGEVPGYLLNQFSLGEFENRLRVATHVDGGQFISLPRTIDGGPDDVVGVAIEPGQSTNGVYVLEQAGERLTIVGSVTGLAPGERLYSARFVTDHAFLVTFRQVDPLFVIDLTQPTEPRVAGELKIPGYSEYLHLLAPDRLLGIGRTVVESPWGGVMNGGVQVSLFDVSDWSNPRALQQLAIGGVGSVSDVSQDHRALAILPERNLLAIPAVLYRQQDSSAFEYLPEFDGALLFRIERDQLVSIGRLGSLLPLNQPWYWGSWRRAAFIGDDVYSVTPAGVRAAPIADPTATRSAELAQ